MNRIKAICLLVFTCLSGYAIAQSPSVQTTTQPPATVKLKDIFLRDICILPDKAAGIYYMVGPGRGAAVVQYKSKDLVNWTGPTEIFKAPAGLWPDAQINAVWAPELHAYKGKYYLFLTFSTNKLFPEQWANWRPRVVRGSQVLVSDSPSGPFTAFQNHSTPSPSLITLDGTLYEEDGIPYMVYCHEWVQISNGTIEYIPLKPDLSEATAEPKLMFRANQSKWSTPSKAEGGYVTDGPYFWKSKSGKLLMIWSSFTPKGYAVGVVSSASGKLAGPWVHDDAPIFDADGGHGMLFQTFDGQLMMALHTPNNGSGRPQPHFYKLEDTGTTLKVTGESIRE